MELARALNALWRRRLLVGIGVLVATAVAVISVFQVSLFPPKLTSRTNEFATASTQILVDTPNSSFANLSEEVDPLNYRAGVFARFLASPEAIGLIAREAGLPANAIEAQGPYEQGQPLFAIEPTAEKRSTQIIGERALYRLRFENNPNMPLISVYAQAPTDEGAKRLADAAPAALRSYVQGIQKLQHTPVKRRVTLRQLGDATGGTVNAGANLQIAVLVFFVVLILWCLLLIPAHTILKGWRSGSDRDGDDGGSPPPSSDHANGDSAEAKRALRPYLERGTF
jgi:hypothetical protein